MKKLLGLFVISISTLMVNGQGLYLQGGVNFANITKTSEGRTEDNNMLTTFNAGLMTRFKSKGPIGVETGLLLTGRGSKAETTFPPVVDETVYVKSTFNPLYLELPLNLLINIPVEAGTGLFFNIGPYVAMGVGGKSKVETYDGVASTKSERKIDFADDNPFTSEQDDASYNKLKRFDYGINLGGGFNFSKFILKVNYGYGLAKINSTESNNSINDKNKYRTVSLSAGFPIGGK